MKKSLLILVLVTASLLNANTLKNNEFDTIKLGETFEKYVIQTDKKIEELEEKIKNLENKDKNNEFFIKEFTKQNEVIHSTINDITIALFQYLEKQEKKLIYNIEKKAVFQELDSLLNKIESDEEVTEQKTPIIHNTKKVNRKSGIFVYSKPFGYEEYFLKKYKHNKILKIESCDNYGWCKILNKNEFVAKYLLK